MAHEAISPFPTLPPAAVAAERDSFVDETLIRSMMLDGRLAMKQRVEHPMDVAGSRLHPEPPVVLGSWL